MREILNNGQVIHQIPEAVTKLHKLLESIPFDAFYGEFLRIIQLLLCQPTNNKHTKNSINLISKFIIYLKNKGLAAQSTEPQDQNEENNQAVEQNFDFLGMDILGRDSFVSMANQQQEVAPQQRTYQNLLDYLFVDILIPFLRAKDVDIRLNACMLMRILLDNVEDIDNHVYRKLKLALIDRIRDRNPKIRKQAVLTLHRFQEADEDDVFSALQFHLKFDNSADVRNTILRVMQVSSKAHESIVKATRDIDPRVRRSAYTKILRRINIKKLKIEQRLVLLNSIIHEENEIIRKLIETEIIPQWMLQYDLDILVLLKGLDITSDAESVEQFLQILLKIAFGQVSQGQTRLYTIAKNFCDTVLNEDHVPRTSVKMPVEVIFLWRCLAEFMKKNEVEILAFERNDAADDDQETIKQISDMIANLPSSAGENGVDEPANSGDEHASQADSNMEQAGSDAENAEASLSRRSSQCADTGDSNTQASQSQSTQPEKQSLIDLVIPDLSRYCSYFSNLLQVIQKEVEEEMEKASARHNSKSHEDETSEDESKDDFYILDIQFKYEQAAAFFLIYEIGDQAQKKTIVSCLSETILHSNLENLQDDYINPLMKALGKNALDANELLDLTVDLSNQIEDELVKQVYGNVQPVNYDDIRRVEVQLADCIAKKNFYKLNMDEAAEQRKYDEASKIQLEVKGYEEQEKELHKKLFEMTEKSMREAKEHDLDIAHYPPVHLKLLHLFCGCLQYGDYKEINALIQSKMEKLVIPGILSVNEQLRSIATKVLGLLCFICPNVSYKNYPLLYQIVEKDFSVDVKHEALIALLDMFMQHGFEEILNFGDNDTSMMESEKNVSATTAASTIARSCDITSIANTTLNTDGSIPETDDEDEDEEQLPENEETLLEIVNQSIKASPKSKAAMQQKATYQLEKLVTQNLRSSNEKLQLTTIKAACRMLMLERIYSPEIMSELILLWYKQKTPEIRQLIGIFLPGYAAAPIQSGHINTRQRLLIECFMRTIEKVWKLSYGQLNASTRSDMYEVDNIDTDNMISFMLELLTGENQYIVVRDVCKRILKILRIQRDDEYEMEEPLLSHYLAIAISKYRLNQLKKQDLKTLNETFETIMGEKRFGELNKRVSSKFTKVSQKIQLLLEKLANIPDTSTTKFDETLIEDPNAQPAQEEEAEQQNSEADNQQQSDSIESDQQHSSAANLSQAHRDANQAQQEEAMEIEMYNDQSSKSNVETSNDELPDQLKEEQQQAEDDLELVFDDE